ncbi:xanthine dehydrogenase family protein subunit M [Isoptericola hypogeus]|uniref:Xanthine dehydrogenase family protein subunit M n=1 Tax=Isoptericola hypogeus TaxID=300179 RepID=A0ABP4VYD3_9MICO
MIPAEFDYVRATSVDDAVAALAAHGEDAKVLAGGQSLLPLMRLRLAVPTALVDVGRVDELLGITDEGAELRIGAATTHHDVLDSPLVAEHAPLLVDVTTTVADPAVRHRGTLGGSLAHADPAGDLPAAALVLGATFEVAGPSGRRTVEAAEFFVDYLQSAMGEGDVLVAVRVPKLGAEWGHHYEKFHRVAQSWATVGVAAVVRRDDGAIAEARIGLTNMGPTPLRAAAAEQALAGVAASADSVAVASAHAADGASPPSDLAGQADYRHHLATVLTRRAVVAAAGI